MHLNRARRSSALFLAATIALTLIAPAAAVAQTPEEPGPLLVLPEIDPPAGKCGIKGGDTVTFSGSANVDATLSSALLRFRDAAGNVIENETKTLDTTSASPDITLTDGVISGDRQLGIDGDSLAKSVELVVTVTRGSDSASGASDEDVTVDKDRPLITGAVTKSREELEVQFSEPVLLDADESTADWKINTNVVPMSISGTEDTRTLTVSMNNRWGEDARPTLDYAPTPTLTRPIYRDCTGNTLPGAGRSQTAKDGTAPAIPVISQIDGKSATGADPVVSKEESPEFVITTVTNGHTVSLWRETNGEPGRQNADTQVDSAKASGGSVTLKETSSLPDAVYTYYARSADTEDDKPNKDLNYTDSAEEGYNVDTKAPELSSATADGSSVLVVFDDALVAGTNSKDHWTISLGSTDYDVTAVANGAQGNQRVLTAAGNVPTGATLTYTPPVESAQAYADAAGNTASAATVPVDSDFTDPSTMTLDLQPETQERASGSHNFTLQLTDYFGAPVQGMRLGGKVLSGPNAARDLDANVFTGTGVFGTCLTNAAGTCSLSYGTLNPGTDLVVGWIDTNGNSSADEVAGTPEASNASGANDVSSHDTVEATTSDPAPDPEPSPDPSPTPNPSPTPTPTPTPSESPEPEPTPSDTPNPTPTEDPTPDPVEERAVTLRAEELVVDLGEPTRLGGLVVASETCRAGAQVRILRDAGTGDEEMGTVTADADGIWSARLGSTRNAAYRVEILAGGPCGDASSDEITVKVRAAVDALVRDPLIKAGGCARIKGRVAPSKAGAPVWLQLKTRGGWRSIDTDQLSGRSRFSFPACFDMAGRKSLRVKWATDGVNAATTSPELRVKVN